MGDVSRVEIRKSAHISAQPDQVWELIRDWAGMLRWWLAAEDGGLQGPTLVRCDLVGNRDGVPRTRRMFLDNGIVAEEQLFYQDDQARRIYYRKNLDPHIIGYVATTYVDAAESDTAIVHVNSWFDVRGTADPAESRGRFESVYDAMFRGYQQFFIRARN